MHLEGIVTVRSATPWALVALLHLDSVPAPAATATPVSPGAAQASALTESRCPTFSWGGVPGAPGYELAVFRLSDAAAWEPQLVTRMSLPADSRSWTPSVGRCLVRGERYAWSVAALHSEGEDGKPEWAPAFLFEVESIGDGADALRPEASTLPVVADPGADGAAAGLAARRAVPQLEDPVLRMSAARDWGPSSGAEATAQPEPVPASPGGVLRVASAASTPSLGSASLAVSQQIHLGASSDLFKDGDVFLWDDADGNTALGRAALASVSGSATHNTAFGSKALEYTTGGYEAFEGSYNTAVGDGALRHNVLGNSNTATGFLALNANTGGFHNTATGSFALAANVAGARNTATGHYALRANVGGGSNTAAGWEALRSNVAGSSNTALGVAALHANTTGPNNTAVGANALFSNTTGDRNTATGVNALALNTTACCNTATGTSALQYNTTGSSNTATGDFSLLHNTTGARNTANGQAALLHSTTGNDNTAQGTVALYQNTLGVRNTASGAYSLLSTTTGDRNTAVGARALQQLTTGHRNTAFGDDAGFNLISGSDNIFIKHPGGTNESNVMRIGTPGVHGTTFIAGIFGAAVDGAPVLVDNAGRLGSVAMSSRAVKQDIRDLGRLADRLLELRPVAFRYRQQVASDPDAAVEFGLIAEEVAEVLPELVVRDSEGRPRGVKYHLLSSLLLGELQRMHGRLEALESRAEDVRSWSRKGGRAGRGRR